MGSSVSQPFPNAMRCTIFACPALFPLSWRQKGAAPIKPEQFISAETNSGASTKSDFDLLKTIVPAFGEGF